MSESPLRRWGRVAFVSFHLFAVGLMAFPSASGGLRRSSWDNPTVKAELRSWSERLQGVTGRSWTQDQFEDRLFSFATGWEDGRRALLDPLRHYYDHAGTAQSWRMFVAPHMHPSDLRADVKIDGSWQPILGPDAKEPWRPRLMGHERIRSMRFRYAWKHYRTPMGKFSKWMAREVAQEYPDASRIRIYYVHWDTLTPEQVRAGEKRDVRSKPKKTLTVVKKP